jgi:hypothetical protein
MCRHTPRKQSTFQNRKLSASFGGVAANSLVTARGSCSSSKFHPAEKLDRSPDVLTVKARLDGPIRGSWKTMKIKAGEILAKERRAQRSLALVAGSWRCRGSAVCTIATICRLSLQFDQFSKRTKLTDKGSVPAGAAPCFRSLFDGFFSHRTAPSHSRPTLKTTTGIGRQAHVVPGWNFGGYAVYLQSELVAKIGIGLKQATEKLGVEGENGGESPSAAKAGIDSEGFMRGLKPPPPSDVSFSAACETPTATGKTKG